MSFRTGVPEPLDGTVVADPGTIPASEAACVAYKWMDQRPTFSLILKNTGNVAIDVYFESPHQAHVYQKKRYVLAVGEAIDGLFEVKNLWLMGVGGAGAFKALLGLRT